MSAAPGPSPIGGGSGPPDGRPQPPHPVRAQELVARAGVVVYESGRSLFDESVLVHLVRSRRYWSDFDVVDHVGRGLGGTRLDVSRGWFSRLVGTTVLLDHADVAVLEVEPGRKFYGSPFRVRGVVDARLEILRFGFRGFKIMIGEQEVGSVVGSGFRGALSSTLRLLDRGGVQVGTIRVFRRWAIWSGAADMVVSVDPGLQGDLRRVVPAIPIVLANIRQARDIAK